MTMDGKVSEIHLPTWRAKVEYWRTHHPVAVGMGIVGILSMIYHASTMIRCMGPNQRYEMVKKYKSRYIVIRPDDPAVKMIKTESGLDRYGKHLS